MKPIVVSTNHRGVFFGYGEPTTAPDIVLRRARMVLFWSAATKGFLGLAAIGPQVGSNVTAAVPEILIKGVESIVEATPEAVKAWEAAPWSN